VQRRNYYAVTTVLLAPLLLVLMTMSGVAATRPTPPRPNPLQQRNTGPTGGTLTILEPSVPDTLDPLLARTAAAADATATVFDSLVRIDAQGAFQADLASRWRRSVDAKTWTFTLDPRAHWQDGEPVTARDIVFTIGLIHDASFGASSTLGFDRITAVSIVGAYTVKIVLSASYGPFLATVGITPILPAHVLSTFSPAQVRSYVAFNRHPIGSGPFIVASFTRDGQVVEDANPDYFRGAPHLDRLVFAPAPTHQGALQRAAHDAAVLVPPGLQLSADDVAARRSLTHSNVLYSPSFAWTHLDLLEHGALSNVVVRRALALATPREAIVTQALRGHGTLADGDQAPAAPTYEPTLYGSYHYDLTTARARLLHAGYKPNGKGVMFKNGQPLDVTLWADASCASCAGTLNLIARSWRTVGIVVHVDLAATAVLFGPKGPLYSPMRFSGSTYNAVLYTWINGPDPDDSAYWARASIVSKAHPLGGNFDGYVNPRVDGLLTRALVTPNGPKRYSLYRQIEHIITTDQPDIFLYWADMISVSPRGLHGYAPTPYNAASTWNAAVWRLGPA